VVDLESHRIREVYARRQDGSRYSWFSPGHLFMMQERERRVLGLLRRHGIDDLSPLRVLDVGTGTGQWLRDLITWGARPDHLVGIDLLPGRIAEARERLPRGVTLVEGSAAKLDLADASFDVVIQSTAFTSILDPEVRRLVAGEMRRVVKPSGLVLWYDYRVDSPGNRDVRGIGRGEIRALFPDCSIELHRVTLAPPITRALATRAWLACCLLERVPWLCTHYLGVIRPTGPPG
jgi:SAM-dependent methyltransferase